MAELRASGQSNISATTSCGQTRVSKQDAPALWEACRLGAYRPAHRTSDRQRDVRTHGVVRETLYSEPL